MTKKHSTSHSITRYSLPKTLLMSSAVGVLAVMSNSVSADCNSEVETCKTSCHNSYAELTTACSEEVQGKYDECGSIWAQILMTREERDICRAIARAEFDSCVAEAERFRDRCKSACDDNWDACTSG